MKKYLIQSCDYVELQDQCKRFKCKLEKLPNYVKSTPIYLVSTKEEAIKDCRKYNHNPDRYRGMWDTRYYFQEIREY